MKRSLRFTALSLVFLTGCAGWQPYSTQVPYTGQGPHAQIERGTPFPPLDILGNVFSTLILKKLVLWNWKVDSHYVSEETEQDLIAFIDQQEEPMMADVKYRLNQWHPVQDIKRLVSNKHVAWPYRLILGLPTTLIGDVIFAGRLFGGDHYNPFTNTVHIYSDLTPVALHEAGHAHDTSQRKYKGTWALARIVPGIDIYQEYVATDDAINHLIKMNEQQKELDSYKILWPAMGTYVGAYIPVIGGSVIGAVGGHALGRNKAHERERYHANR